MTFSIVKSSTRYEFFGLFEIHICFLHIFFFLLQKELGFMDIMNNMVAFIAIN